MSDRERQRAKVVQQTRANVNRARRKLVAQHRELAAARERNREQNDGSDAVTVPKLKSTTATMAGKHSTVPQQPKKSSVPAPKRRYGLRFRTD